MPNSMGPSSKSVEPSPQFTLTKQLGQTVTLDSLRDQVVVLTFLYTYCPDVCPIVTTQLRDVQTQLAADSSEVEFVAISVDPERDTVKTAREYLDRWELKDEWQFLVGSHQTLAPIWQSYYVDPYADGPKGEAPTPEPRGAVGTLSAAIAERYLVIHSAPVFLIDRNGRRRVVFTSPLDPSEIGSGHQGAAQISGERLSGGRLKVLLCGLGYLREPFRVSHCDIGQHLAVYLDAGRASDHV